MFFGGRSRRRLGTAAGTAAPPALVSAALAASPPHTPLNPQPTHPPIHTPIQAVYERLVADGVPPDRIVLYGQARTL